ncbi:MULTISPECIES: rod-determining factor RdfA [Halorussus]|uniref:rod-determining factor RdfA n=1 Tax=Halorussus TaxID=1070314 RepID=UPI000E20CD41|nr:MULTISPECIES: rod-determining factor RdfA [Halorussus]NHN60706.1 hypothetical protein [Halorussus sp. JP-T4]
MPPAADDGPTTKVGRLLERYDLGEAFGDRLEAAWLGEGVERRSLRDLADLFNRELLAVAMEDAGMAALDGEVENIYRLLTDDDVSSGMRTDARRRLDRNGVDVESLERDFVSYQAIRTYLKDVREAEYDDSAADDRVEKVAESVRRLRSRTVSVAEGNLDQLRNADELELGESRVLVDVTVLCEDCGAQYSYDELLERGGCDCEPDVRSR